MGSDRGATATGGPASGGNHIQGASYDFADLLLVKARDAGLRKTERTRHALLASLARELATGGRSGVKVAAVAAGAGAAHGTYYRYFADSSDGMDALIDAFSQFCRSSLDGAGAGDAGSRERVRAIFLVQVALFRDNGALMACLIAPEPAIMNGDTAAAVQARYWEWLMRIAAWIARGRSAMPGAPRQTPAQLLPLAYALAGMVEALLARIYLRRDPELTDLAEDEDALADFLTDIWWRGAFGGSISRD
ncbi:hypothetical protein [Microbaculum marinum]|uniref:HTH tetR-type domain-containing protein n=1 Tax=Microbaculum marinum TaxID=1764581 RepID=A0AAW9RWA7_9HYPH